MLNKSEKNPTGGANPNSTRPTEGGDKKPSEPGKPPTLDEAWRANKHRKFTREEARVNKMGEEKLYDHLFPVELDPQKVQEAVEKKLGCELSENRLKKITKILEAREREKNRGRNPIFNTIIEFVDTLGLNLTNMESYRLTLEFFTRVLNTEGPKPMPEDDQDNILFQCLVDFMYHWDEYMDGVQKAERALRKTTDGIKAAEAKVGKIASEP
jgi:hypothetical protein